MAGNRFLTDVARNLLLRGAGVNPSTEMTPEERILAYESPDIAARSFTKLFGGQSCHERPRSLKWTILCINGESQPYAPHSPGKSGLVFIYPDAAVPEDRCETFLLFLNKNPKLSRTKRQISYLGTYTKIPTVHAPVGRKEWNRLPKSCREAWLRRIYTSTSPDVREAHARINLHRQGGPSPSADAIRKWLEKNSGKCGGIKQAEIRDAFISGEEKLGFEVIKYLRYDRGIAELLQNDLE